ncbi:MAG: hypothetical protein GY814_08585 [Gammaproteobacteria bacterium]|nr:hypothetical protein [Gammaproteobacteria bacterium]
MRSNDNEDGLIETFTLVGASSGRGENSRLCINDGDYVSILTSQGTYLGVDSGDNIVASKSTIGDTERFTLSILEPDKTGCVTKDKSIALKANNGLYISFHNSGLLSATSQDVGLLEIFNLINDVRVVNRYSAVVSLLPYDFDKEQGEYRPGVSSSKGFIKADVNGPIIGEALEISGEYIQPETGLKTTTTVKINSLSYHSLPDSGEMFEADVDGSYIHRYSGPYSGTREAYLHRAEITQRNDGNGIILEIVIFSGNTPLAELVLHPVNTASNSG